MRKTIVLLSLLLFGFSQNLQKIYRVEPVTIKASPRLAMEPAKITLSVHIADHKDNRWLSIVWHNGASDISLPGEFSELYYERVLEGLLVGEYTAIATLVRVWTENNKQKQESFTSQVKFTVRGG